MHIFSRLSTWTHEQSKALAGFVASGLSYARTAAAINEEFKTHYTREAAIGRAWRMGIISPDRPKVPPKPRKKQPYKPRPKPAFPSIEVIALRCSEIVPGGIGLVNLATDGCRWPYGEGPYTFCNHPQFDGSSYCSDHFDLSRRRMS
jgi:GcrA cell cycle regulator